MRCELINYAQTLPPILTTFSNAFRFNLHIQINIFA